MASRLRIEAPDFAPAIGGLLDVANVIDQADPHFAQGVAYMTEPHGPAKAAPAFCYSAITVAEGEKDFESPDPAVGDGFAVYRGFECDLVEWESYDRRAADLLAAGESAGVEDGFQEMFLEGPELVTVSTGVTDIVHAVALLEEYAGNTYNGLPTFHVGRYGATHMLRRGLAKRNEDTGRITTSQGSLVANGAGYDRGPGATALSKSYWVWATGQVNLFRGQVHTARALNAPFNRAVGLAERIYVPTVEGFIAGVRVEEETP